MASSRVIASTSPVNSDLQQNSFTHLIAAVDDLQREHSKSFASMNMDDLLKNIYGDSADDDNGGVVSPSRIPKNKTVDEVWKEIVEGSGGRNREPEMTLEDFLTKAGAVTEEDVRIPEMPPTPPVFGQFQTTPPPLQHMHSSENGIGGFGVESVGFGNGIDGGMVSVAAGSNGGGTVGRGKRRRTVEEPPMDKITQQKQRRMIKNRESAARSRERKQAYTIELESLVTQLEEENARLLREEAEQSKERFKQLMENLIPVVEKRRPPQSIRRVHSMSW